MRKGAREVQRKETVPFDWFLSHGNPFNKRHGQNNHNHTNGVHSFDDAAEKSNGSSPHRNTYSDSDESPEMEKVGTFFFERNVLFSKLTLFSYLLQLCVLFFFFFSYD